MGMYGGVENDACDTPANAYWRRRGYHIALATGLILLTSFAVAVLVDSSTKNPMRSSLDEAEADSEVRIRI